MTKSSTRLQVSVPNEIAEMWKNAAAATGVSLSNWIAMRVNRPDASGVLTQVLQRIDHMAGARAPKFDEEERDMITQLAHEHGKGRALTSEQVLRIGVRTMYRQLSLNAEDVEKVRDE